MVPVQPPEPITGRGAAVPAASAPGVSPAAVSTGTPSPLHFSILLAALVFAAFPQVLLGLETFIVRDYGFFAYPLAHFQRECFWRGELPLWNPFNNCGIPFLAQWNTMPLYPPALIYLLLPLNWSLSFFCLLHLFWAGLGMYFLAHRWTGSRLGASVAGLAFVFNGFTLNLLMWPSHIATLSWMPWVILCVERAWLLGGSQLVLAAVVGALQMLGGGPETILFAWLILAALWLLALWRADSPGISRGAMARRFPVVVCLVAGLTAAQLLPFLDLAAHSQREQGFADTRWSMPAWGWANFLVPMAFGHRWSKGLFFQYEQAWTSSYYLGVAPLLLALVAICNSRQNRVRFLSVAAVAALLLALGDQLFLVRWLRQLIPQLTLMTYPVKYLTVVTLAVPLLAAFGVARLSEKRDPESKSRLLFLGGVLLALIAAVLFCAWRFPFPTDDFHNTLLNGSTRAALLIIALLLLSIMSSHAATGGNAPGPRRAIMRFAPFSVLLLIWVDTWTHEPSQNPTVAPFVYTPGLARTKLAMKPQPGLGHSRAMVTPSADARFRQFLLSDFKDNYLIKRIGYFADCNLLDAIPKVDGFFSLYPRECGELMSALYSTTNSVPPALADFLAVSQITAPGQFFEWQPRGTFLPLASAGQRPVFLDDTNALRALFNPQFDARKFVLLPPDLSAANFVTNQTRAEVVFQSGVENQKPKMLNDLEVHAAEPSLVVLSQTYYHSWRAYLDGQPVPLFRANYAFQAVQVPAGAHHLHLAYEDHAFQLGAAISLLSLLACAIGWFQGERSRAASGVRRCAPLSFLRQAEGDSPNESAAGRRTPDAPRGL